MVDRGITKIDNLLKGIPNTPGYVSPSTRLAQGCKVGPGEGVGAFVV